MGQQTRVDEIFGSYLEETLDQLTDKENYLLELGATEGTCKLLTTPGNEFAVLDYIDPQSRIARVRYLAGGGEVVLVQNGAIAFGSAFQAQAGGKVGPFVAGTALGVKRSPDTNGANGDFITGVILPRTKGAATTTVAVANTGTPDGVAHISGQVKDADGNALAGRFLVHLFTSASAYGAPSAQGGTAAAGANTRILVADVANDLLQVLTHSDGSWAIDVTTAAGGETVYAHATVVGTFATANAAITGN